MTSNEAGIMYDLCDPVIGDDMKAMERHFKGRLDWIWEEHLDDSVENALKMLEDLIQAP